MPPYHRWSSQRPESLGECSKKKLAVAALLKPPLCYDRVRVCAFCSQFLNDQEAYRVRPRHTPLPTSYTFALHTGVYLAVTQLSYA